MSGWIDRKDLLPISELICAYQWMDSRGGGGGRKCMVLEHC